MRPAFFVLVAVMNDQFGLATFYHSNVRRYSKLIIYFKVSLNELRKVAEHF